MSQLLAPLAPSASPTRRTGCHSPLALLTPLIVLVLVLVLVLDRIRFFSPTNIRGVVPCEGEPFILRVPRVETLS
jgi:hypothetical protein